MTETSNAQQIEYWNGPTGRKWAEQQKAIDLNLAAITEGLMPFADARPGMRVLDVGCGCGTTTLMLAKSVTPGGDVTGVDISAPMLAVARRRGANANFMQADAATHLFKPTHDLVFSRFGVMFFADPAAAFANIRKALKPGGRLAFVCWRALPENGWAALPFAAARDLLPPQEPMDPHAPGPFAFADAKRLMGILGAAGFHEVRVENFDTVMNMGATPEAGAEQALNIGPLARAAAELDETTRHKIRARVKSALEKFKTSSGIAPPAACWLVAARV